MVYFRPEDDLIETNEIATATEETLRNQTIAASIWILFILLDIYQLFFIFSGWSTQYEIKRTVFSSVVSFNVSCLPLYSLETFNSDFCYSPFRLFSGQFELFYFSSIYVITIFRLHSLIITDILFVFFLLASLSVSNRN